MTASPFDTILPSFDEKESADGRTDDKEMADSSDDDQRQKPHAILIPYPLQGHVIPAVHLAVKLASRGFTVTFLNTHSVHHQISRAHHNDPTDDIFAAVRRQRSLDIRYSTLSDGLPLSFDRSLHHDQFMASLLHVFSAHVEEAVGRIVGSPDSRRVRFLVADTFFVWPSTVARKFGLAYVSFWTEPALVFSLYYHMDLLRINGHFDCQSAKCRDDPIDYIPGIKAIEPKDMASYLQDTDTSSVCHQIISSSFKDVKSADFIICNTVEELEPETISALKAVQPFYSIGPIVPEGASKGTVATSLWAESDCTQWLNTRPRGSVLYVSFGSYAHTSRADLAEIAHGLRLSGVSFVWVIRPDIVSSEEADPLPDGYKDSLGGGLFRDNIREVKKKLAGALMPDGSSVRNMDQFVNDLTNKIDQRGSGTGGLNPNG
ncbi:hypothetical protein SAY86_002559 [Trapa natans]|uniref:Uncharacterized protein n=1 Tax=Trapa natans TaxID=22666 RepID=A0AAN7R2K9_TRANT|nr:hypothetical protein SAY86_002559 [Trapa natans]